MCFRGLAVLVNFNLIFPPISFQTHDKSSLPSIHDDMLVCFCGIIEKLLELFFTGSGKTLAKSGQKSGCMYYNVKLL